MLPQLCLTGLQSLWIHPFVVGCLVLSQCVIGRGAMFSSGECQLMAAEKIARAEREPENRERLRTAAHAWEILADQMRRLEASLRGAGKRRARN